MKARVSNLTAIFFAVFAFTCWVLGDSCIKWIGQYGLPPTEIVAFMGVFMAVTLALQAAVRRRLDSLRPRSVIRQVLRAMLDMANIVCVVIALRHLSLTMFYRKRYAKRILCREIWRVILETWDSIRKKICRVGVVLYRSRWQAAKA
jgi:predicted membrane protein